MKTKTEILVKALYQLADDIESQDGVPEAVISEGAERIVILAGANKAMAEMLAATLGDLDDLRKIAGALFARLTTKKIGDDDLDPIVAYQRWRKDYDHSTTSCNAPIISVDPTKAPQ